MHFRSMFPFNADFLIFSWGTESKHWLMLFLMLTLNMYLSAGNQSRNLKFKISNVNNGFTYAGLILLM